MKEVKPSKEKGYIMRFPKTAVLLGVSLISALAAVSAPAQETTTVLAVYGDTLDKPESAQPFRYMWNAKGAIGKAENYTALPFVEKDKIYAVVGENGKPLVNIPVGRNWMCAPGLEAARDAEKTDRYFISAFTMPEDSKGNVWIINGNLQHPYGKTEKDAVNLKIFVNDEQKQELSAGASKVPAMFQAKLGKLKKGDTIYMAVGPGEKYEADLFKLFFTVADIPEGTEPPPAKNIIFPPADTSHPKMAPDGSPMKNYKATLDSHNAALLRNMPEIVFIGDSITAGWNQEVMKEKFAPKYKTMQIGIGGDWTQNVLWRVENGVFDQVKPKLVIQMIGTNNIANGYGADEVVAGNATIIKAVQAKSPETKILLLGIFPRGRNVSEPINATIKQVNEKLSAMADNKNVFYLDIGSKLAEADGTLAKEVFYDGLHLAKEGYIRWSDAVMPTVEKLVPPQAK